MLAVPFGLAACCHGRKSDAVGQDNSCSGHLHLSMDMSSSYVHVYVVFRSPIMRHNAPSHLNPCHANAFIYGYR
jgi:hypothetical protein